MQWGPVRTVARKAYDLLGLHGKVSLPQTVSWSKSKAYTSIRSTGEGVNINLAGREIDGVVDPGDYETVRDAIMDRLATYVDPKTGKKPIAEIHKREEVFKGKFQDTAPDIFMVPTEGYSLTHAKSSIEDADWVSGDHRMQGTIVAVGPNVTPFESTPALIDMAPTLVAALDAPTAVTPSGRILHEIVGAGAELKQREATTVIPGMTAPNAAEVTDTEADEMEEHLRGLGYIE
jgi:predicted AlkP superfamily phosphohydrolase/phosphomutase